MQAYDVFARAAETGALKVVLTAADARTTGARDGRGRQGARLATGCRASGSSASPQWRLVSGARTR